MGESSGTLRAASSFGAPDFRSRNFRVERRRKFFRTLAKHAYPKQTAFEIRELTKAADGGKQYAESTIYDWIAGRSDPPLSVFLKVIGEIYD